MIGALGFWVCRPLSLGVTRLHPTVSLDSAKVNSWLQPHSQSRSSHEMLCYLRKRVNIYSLFFDHRMIFRNASSKTGLLLAMSQCRLAPPLSASISSGLAKLGALYPSSPGLVRGEDGAVGVLTGTESAQHLLVSYCFLPSTATDQPCLWCCHAPHAQLSQISACCCSCCTSVSRGLCDSPWKSH